ncbi:MAG: 2-succinyl-5-enolpyruvyl-6-hydroxy-3-cyclohexene-1-carboxylic-acid synthase [Verrucomicrobia bacterium]|nr:2-succinyl-5-enolpyruvyl-6-hydroxy-3-cyclohexene-1-carboxylic-acid synthase [Verrucomicrobiota bacterium]
MESTTQTFDALSRSTPNAAWGALAMEVLARLGVETVVSSPGSRSTPLVYAAVRNAKLEVVPVLDERAAGFFALGIAKRTGRPVVLVCTSGSAVANYAPAVAEADHSGTPLLILTADRAPEERHCGAGQTIDQIHYFGEQVRAFEELPLPEVTPGALRHLRQSLVHALDRALHGNPGPVHLNCPFREPLAPDPEAEPILDAASLENAATVLTRSTEAVPATGRPDAVALERLGSHQHGCIVVGDVNPGGAENAAAFADAIKQLSKALGWPVLADVLNPLRAHAEDARALITHYHAILRDTDQAATLAPTAILQIGTLPTSKVLRSWLAQVDAATFLLPGRPVNIDPLHRVATVLQGDAVNLAQTVSPQTADPDWQTRWQTAQSEATARVDAELRACAGLFGGKVPWLLSQTLPAGTAVFFANSLSIRFAEWFWCAGKGRGALLGNRGVNGIDGNLATALGVAHGGAPTVLLCGDLAFLHDHAALLLARELRGSLTVILLNNPGGGVFELLPIAQHAPPYERYFATPQNVDLGKLCGAHGIRHECIADWPSLEDALLETPPGLRVLEVQTDRQADRDCLASIFN